MCQQLQWSVSFVKREEMQVIYLITQMLLVIYFLNFCTNKPWMPVHKFSHVYFI